MKFETLIRYKALDQVYSLRSTKLLNHIMEDPDFQQQIGTKKIQFDATPDLHADLEEVVSLLAISKREFLQAAVSQALEKAHQIIREEQVIQTLEEAASPEGAMKC